MKLRVGVIFGGVSVEHEVSIISAVQAMKQIDEEKYEVIPIYIGKDREWYTGKLLKNIEVFSDLDLMKKYASNVVLYNKKDDFVLVKKKGFKRVVDYVDLILPIVHGTNVEDGTLQGYLEMIGIPYVGSNVFAAAIGQDKVFQKQIFSSSNIPVSDYIWFFDYEYKENEEEILKKIKKLGYPVMVKPARLGSSVGISKVKSEKDIKEALEEAIKYDEKILVEKVVENLIEVNCSVLGNYQSMEASELEEVMGVDEFLSYRDKYLGDGGKKTGGSSKGMASTNRILPARLNEKMTNEVKELSKKAFKVLNASGVVRIDYLIDKKTNKIYLNEVNTIPGSLSSYLWKAKKKNQTELFDDLIAIAIDNKKDDEQIQKAIHGNLPERFDNLKGTKLKK